MEDLKKSSRRYEEANIDISMQNPVPELLCVFQYVGVYLKKLKLKLDDGADDPARLLNLFPNLEWLKLDCLRNGFLSEVPLKLSKLKYLETWQTYNHMLSALGECEMIEEVKIKQPRDTNPAFVEQFMLLNEKSLKKVEIHGHRHENNPSLSFIGLNAIKLDSLILKDWLLNTRQLENFLQTQTETLKTLECHRLDVMDEQFLDFVSEKLQKLEVLAIYECRTSNIQGFDGLSKLKCLRKIRIDHCDVLRGLVQDVNPNLEEMEVPMNAGIEFDAELLENLQICLPNLKKLTVSVSLFNDVASIDQLLSYFNNLEHLAIKDARDVSNFLYTLEGIMYVKDHGEMLKKITVYSTFWPSGYIRHGNLTIDY